MTPMRRLLLVILAVLPLGCLPSSAESGLERRTERTFDVAAGSLVRVSIAGGPITVTTGPPGRVEATLLEEVFAHSERDAEEALANVESVVAQRDDEVEVTGRRKRSGIWEFWNGRQVRFTATLVVPSDVRLDVDTSGGGIRVHGERTASVDADTSGGSIAIDSGTDLTLDTSGGGIRVGQALGSLDADTSGGSITVEYVGASARDVRLNTSGGGIRVGVDPRAALTIDAGTSGGGVNVDGLPFEPSSRERNHARGTINGGGGRLTASTSGGSVRISAAR
jgi:SHS2 domain-containing protein